MRTFTMRPSLVAVAVLAVAASAAAQAPSPAPPAAATPAPGGPDTVKSILEQGLEPPPGGYTYNPQGRRDPFVSLQKPVEANRGPGTRPPGVKGFLIQEVALKGIVRDKTGYIAILLGTDGHSYFVRVGERLFDGVVTAIDAANITFRQEVTDPLSPVKSRDVKKSLYPSEEIR
jgi:type IV pilus assembly protein PilP